MFRVAICLSDSVKRAYISSYIETIFSRRELEVSILCFSSSKQIFRQGIKSLQPDIFIFDPLDEEGNMSVFALLIKHRYPHVTSFTIGGLDSFSSSDLHTLNPVFPIYMEDLKEFCKNLIKAYRYNLGDTRSFTYFSRPSYKTYPVEDIQYFASAGRITHLISTDDSNISFYCKLDNVEDQLSYKRCIFIRIHKSYLVNLKYISSYNRKSITLKSGETISISNYENYKLLKQLFGV